jgi:hypothetical protein
VVFYDASGVPIETHEVHFSKVIPAGLGVRVSGESVDSSVEKLTTSWDSGVASMKLEFRVLDFELVD